MDSEDGRRKGPFLTELQLPHSVLPSHRKARPKPRKQQDDIFISSTGP